MMSGVFRNNKISLAIFVVLITVQTKSFATSEPTDTNDGNQQESEAVPTPKDLKDAAFLDAAGESEDKKNSSVSTASR